MCTVGYVNDFAINKSSFIRSNFHNYYLPTKATYPYGYGDEEQWQ